MNFHEQYGCVTIFTENSARTENIENLWVPYYNGNNDIYIYIYMIFIHICLLLISMLWHGLAISESKGDKLWFSAECRIRTQGLWNRISSRLNASWQSDWAIEDQAKNLNSIAGPYDQRAFSPFNPTAGGLSHLALAIYMFVVNFETAPFMGNFNFRPTCTRNNW